MLTPLRKGTNYSDESLSFVVGEHFAGASSSGPIGRAGGLPPASRQTKAKPQIFDMTVDDLDVEKEMEEWETFRQSLSGS